MRLGAVTHSVDMEQRYVPLSFTAGAGTLTATAPRERQHRAARPLHALRGRRERRAVGGEDGHGQGQRPADRERSPQPAAGATFTAPATVSIAAEATDADGTVTKVEFFNGSTKLGEDTTAPYTYDWTGVAAGSYSLTARATDNLGATTTSAARTITVSAANAPPTASITSPASGATFAWHADDHHQGGGERRRRHASGRSSSSAADGATKLGEDTTAPYSYRWKNAPSGVAPAARQGDRQRRRGDHERRVGVTVRAK